MSTVSKPIETQDMLLNMGPQHPSTHGVLRLVIRTDGEMVSEVTPVVGYLHRCAEKIGENLRYEQFVPYTDRMDYLSSMSDNLGFCLAVEKLLTIEIPPRAQVIRVIMAELNRVASHLLAFGTGWTSVPSRPSSTRSASASSSSTCSSTSAARG
jgi:NADH-quinone oxidoreductase subunit D